jgi:hypothetical protein
MTASNKHFDFICFLFLTCFGCIPLQQQISESQAAELEGFVGPLIVDEEKFHRITSSSIYDRMNVDMQFLPSNNNITYESTFGGELVYIRNCKCLENIKIIQSKLIVTHSYGGGESNRESTKLIWNGVPYKNSKGEYIVDVILFSDKVDIRRAMLREKKILDIAAVQMKDASLVWINLIGYDRLIKYTY